MSNFNHLPELLLDQLSKDGMSMLIGGAKANETINNSNARSLFHNEIAELNTTTNN